MSYRIFIGMTEIAGYYSNLAAGLRAKEHLVTQAGTNAHVFKYATDGTPAPAVLRLYENIVRLRSGTPHESKKIAVSAEKSGRRKNPTVKSPVMKRR